MKRIIALLIFVNLFLIAQDNNQVELPDFVIIGKRKAQLPTKEKIKPQGSIFTDDYLKPAIPLSEHKITDFKNLSLEFQKESKGNIFNNRFEFGLGFYTWPEVDLIMSKVFKNSYIMARIFGNNEREYISKSGVNQLNASFKYNYLIPNDYDFLPGSQIFLKTEYDRKISNFFASKYDDVKKESRTIHNFYIDAGWEHKYYDNFQFLFNIKQNLMFLNNIKNKSYENNLYFDFNPSYKISDVTLNNDLSYSATSFNQEDSLVSDNTIMNNTFYANYEFNQDVAIFAGVFLSKAKEPKLFARPHLGFIWRTMDRTWIKLKYTPVQKMYTTSNILENNLYYSLNEKSILETQNSAYNFTIDYQYYNFLQNLFSVSYIDYKNYSIFKYNDSLATFELNNAKVKQLTIENTTIYNTGYYGIFTSNLKFNFIKTKDGDKVPFIPFFTLNLFYNYELFKNFYIEPKASLQLKILSDTSQKQSLNNFDLGIKFYYKLGNKLDVFVKFNNIIDNENYYYYYYRQRKFEILGGITYSW